MLSVFNTSTDKALKLSINTSSTLTQPSCTSKVTQQLDSFNLKLYSDTQEKRLNPFDSDDLKTTKKHKISLGNINMLAKYSHDISKGVAEEEQIESLSRNTSSQCSTPKVQTAPLETAPLKTEQTRLYQPKPKNMTAIPRVKPQSHQMPQFGKTGLNKPLNPQEANFGHLPLNPSALIASNMNELLRKQFIDSQLSSLNSYQQLMQLQLSLMGTSPDYTQSLFQDLQTLQRLKEECKALEGLKKSLFVNSYKQQPHPAYVRRPTPHMMVRGPNPQMNKEQRRVNPMNRIMEQRQMGFQGKRFIEEKMRSSPEVRVKESQASPQFTINVVQKNMNKAPVQSTTAIGMQSNIKSQEQLMQNKPLFVNKSEKSTTAEGSGKILGQNIKFFGLNKVQINSEGTQSLVL